MGFLKIIFNYVLASFCLMIGALCLCFYLSEEFQLLYNFSNDMQRMYAVWIFVHLAAKQNHFVVNN